MPKKQNYGSGFGCPPEDFPCLATNSALRLRIASGNLSSKELSQAFRCVCLNVDVPMGIPLNMNNGPRPNLNWRFAEFPNRTEFGQKWIPLQLAAADSG